MACNLIQDKDDVLLKVCSNCGKSIRTDKNIEKINLICSSDNNQTEIINIPIRPKQDLTTYNKMFNLLSSVKDFISDGFTLVSKEDYETRLNICNECQFRVNNTCSKCGCNLSLKATGRAFQCPEHKWPEIPK